MTSTFRISFFLQDVSYFSNTDKIRLLMIYMISQDGIHDQDRRRLLEQAKLSADESQAITNLHALGVRLTPAEKPEDKGPYSYYAKKPNQKKKDSSSESMGYDLSRYVPMMKFMLEVCFVILISLYLGSSA